MSRNVDAGAVMLRLHEDDIGRRVYTYFWWCPHFRTLVVTKTTSKSNKRCLKLTTMTSCHMESHCLAWIFPKVFALPVSPPPVVDQSLVTCGLRVRMGLGWCGGGGGEVNTRIAHQSSRREYGQVSCSMRMELQTA